MTGQFYLSLLNPALAFAFAGTAYALLQRWPKQVHLLPLSLCFLYLGLAFISQQWPLLSRPGATNYAGNAMFFASILLVCVSALMRAGVKVPRILFGSICAMAIAGFLWFDVVTPSRLGRIYFMHGCFVALLLLTAGCLVGHGVRSVADRLFVAGTLIGALLAAFRLVSVNYGLLQVEQTGDLTRSSYWASIQGITPFLSVLIAALFLFALVLDIMQSLQSDAEQDFLTGLLNRRGFESQAKQRLAGAGTARLPQALLVADIDDFKQINDRFGHAVGDSVIAAVGRVLTTYGHAELAGRTGGEEFALFYENGSRRLLEKSAAALRDALAVLDVVGLPEGYQLTLSMGLHIREGSEDLDEMMRRADRALYEAKATGKDRAVLTPLRLRSV